MDSGRGHGEWRCDDRDDFPPKKRRFLPTAEQARPRPPAGVPPLGAPMPRPLVQRCHAPSIAVLGETTPLIIFVTGPRPLGEPRPRPVATQTTPLSAPCPAHTPISSQCSAAETRPRPSLRTQATPPLPRAAPPVRQGALCARPPQRREAAPGRAWGGSETGPAPAPLRPRSGPRSAPTTPPTPPATPPRGEPGPAAAPASLRPGTPPPPHSAAFPPSPPRPFLIGLFLLLLLLLLLRRALRGAGK
ncbi:basic proline-rich protein-like [Pseudopipra pipra]|uniref:basic proline-rich protein-like n=1 Tax=Pseudopipra pipra TaxID=415032 RepID=UPI0031395B2A